MKTKKTAVEWLTNMLPNIDFKDDPFYKDLYQQAKAMEKEQIKDAYKIGKIDANIPDEFNHTFEQYYKKKYEKR